MNLAAVAIALYVGAFGSVLVALAYFVTETPGAHVLLAVFVVCIAGGTILGDLAWGSDTPSKTDGPL